jgi:hypothetical protein
MAWYPLGNKRPIAPGPNDPPIEVIGAILHTDGGDSKSLYGYFSSGASKGIESHFHVPKVGPIEQYRDTAYEADANLKANSFMSGTRRLGYVSIETQGLAKGEWNGHQIDGIKSLLKWLSEAHNFPLTRCKTPTSPGVGYHIMFGAPGPWTPVSKVCPGPDRVRQFEQVLVPWFTSNQQVPPVNVGGVLNVEEIMAELAKQERANQGRYGEIRDALQVFRKEEAARYGEYVKRFQSIESRLPAVKAA